MITPDQQKWKPAMGAVIKCWGPTHALDQPIKGEYLASFDPDAHDGGGDATFTQDIRQALVFSSAVEAIKAWQTQSKVKPFRKDGRPNRPLTTFSASFENV